MNQLTAIMTSSAMAVLLTANSPAIAAEQGYVLNLNLTTPNASDDPDRVWTKKDLPAEGNPPRHPDIYTARLSTPAGEWLLTQTSNDCNMQSVCTTMLLLKTTDGKSRILAYPRVSLGASATLSLNYKKITTEELDDAANAITGSYDVEPIK